MESSQGTWDSEPARGTTNFTPSVWIEVRNQAVRSSPSDRHYVATIMGLQALKCAGISGYGKTEEEAKQNLRRKVLQFLEFNSSVEPPD